ncbi:MAG: hypothetical protein MK135_06810 [Polyangiaceae bacterium]|nr:hypothetical protein [Polyangiaceae bacterium]
MEKKSGAAPSTELRDISRRVLSANSFLCQGFWRLSRRYRVRRQLARSMSDSENPSNSSAGHTFLPKPGGSPRVPKAQVETAWHKTLLPKATRKRQRLAGYAKVLIPDPWSEDSTYALESLNWD